MNPDTLDSLPEGLPPVLVLETIAPGRIMTDLLIAMELLNRDTLSSILVLEDQPQARTPLSDVNAVYTLNAPSETSDIARLTDSFHLNLTAFGLLSFAVGLFIVYAAIGLAFEQRRVLFRTLRALGLPQRKLVWLLAAEAFVLASIGGTLGIALGYVLASALLPGVAATLSGLYGASVSGSLSSEASLVANGLCNVLSWGCGSRWGQSLAIVAHANSGASDAPGLGACKCGHCTHAGAGWPCAFVERADLGPLG